MGPMHNSCAHALMQAREELVLLAAAHAAPHLPHLGHHPLGMNGLPELRPGTPDMWALAGLVGGTTPTPDNPLQVGVGGFRKGFSRFSADDITSVGAVLRAVSNC